MGKKNSSEKGIFVEKFLYKNLEERNFFLKEILQNNK